MPLYFFPDIRAGYFWLHMAENVVGVCDYKYKRPWTLLLWGKDLHLVSWKFSKMITHLRTSFPATCKGSLPHRYQIL